MTAQELAALAVENLRQASRVVAPRNSWRRDSPLEYEKVMAYLGGGPRPAGIKTKMGLGLLYADDARRAPSVSGGKITYGGGSYGI